MLSPFRLQPLDDIDTLCFESLPVNPEDIDITHPPQILLRYEGRLEGQTYTLHYALQMAVGWGEGFEPLDESPHYPNQTLAFEGDLDLAGVSYRTSLNPEIQTLKGPEQVIFYGKRYAFLRLEAVHPHVFDAIYELD